MRLEKYFVSGIDTRKSRQGVIKHIFSLKGQNWLAFRTGDQILPISLPLRVLVMAM